MEAIIVLLVLALSLSLVLRFVDETIPVHLPAVVTRLGAVAVASILAWAMGYSVFTAFGHDLSAAWLHPVATGLALVAVADATRTVITGIARRQPAPAKSVV